MQSLQSVYADVLGLLVSKAPAGSDAQSVLEGDLRGFLDKLDRGEENTPEESQQLQRIYTSLQNVMSAAKYLQTSSHCLDSAVKLLSDHSIADSTQMAAAAAQISSVLALLDSIEAKAAAAANKFGAKLEELERRDTAFRDNFNITVAGAGLALATLPYFQGMLAKVLPDWVSNTIPTVAACGLTAILGSLVLSNRARLTQGLSRMRQG